MPQVIIEVRRQVQQNIMHGALAESILRECCFEVHLWQHRFEHCRSVLDVFFQFGFWHVAGAEFQWAVANVARVAQGLTNEMVEISNQVAAEISSGIADARRDEPETFIRRMISLDFGFQLIQVMLEKGEKFSLHELKIETCEKQK